MHKAFCVPVLHSTCWPFIVAIYLPQKCNVYRWFAFEAIKFKLVDCFQERWHFSKYLNVSQRICKKSNNGDIGLTSTNYNTHSNIDSNKNWNIKSAAELESLNDEVMALAIVASANESIKIKGNHHNRINPRSIDNEYDDQLFSEPITVEGESDVLIKRWISSKNFKIFSFFF